MVGRSPDDVDLELVSSSQANFYWQDLAAKLGVDSAEVSEIAAMQESEDKLQTRTEFLEKWWTCCFGATSDGFD